MKKCSTLAFFAFMQFIYIIAIAMCFYLFLYKGTQIFIVLFFLLLAGGINSYCLFKEIKSKKNRIPEICMIPGILLNYKDLAIF